MIAHLTTGENEGFHMIFLFLYLFVFFPVKIRELQKLKKVGCAE